MDILDELKQLSSAQDKNNENYAKNTADISTYRHSVLLNSIKKIHDYLFELTNNLNQLEHTESVQIHIPGFGSIANLQQNAYELLWENRSKENRVVLNFCTRIVDACPIPLDNDYDPDVEQLLKNSGVNYTFNEDNLILKGKIHSSLVFSITQDSTDISLRIENFNRLGKSRYTINEKLVNDDLFEQLSRFLLHRENNLLDILSNSSLEISAQIPVDDLMDESGVHTQEMDISRIRSLFTKEVMLFLTYHNVIKEIDPRSGDFIFGRSRKSQITVNSDLASRQHAKIVYRKGKYVLIDQSTNGTFVKTQGGKEVYVQGEELPLTGSGFISLGKSVTVDNEHIIYFSCQ